jgi:hypothetical protein
VDVSRCCTYDILYYTILLGLDKCYSTRQQMNFRNDDIFYFRRLESVAVNNDS